MLSAIDKMRHSQIWDLLGEYADIREHLEELFHSLCRLQMLLDSELDDLSDELDDLQETLDSCSLKLFRFKNPGSVSTEDESPFPQNRISGGPDVPDDDLLFVESNSQDEGSLPWDEIPI